MYFFSFVCIGIGASEELLFDVDKELQSLLSTVVDNEQPCHTTAESLLGK